MTTETKSAQARMEEEREVEWAVYQKAVEPINEAVAALRAEFDRKVAPLQDRNGVEYKKYAEAYEAIGEKYASEIAAEAEAEEASLNAAEFEALLKESPEVSDADRNTA